MYFRALLLPFLIALFLLAHPGKGTAQFETSLGTLQTTGDTLSCYSQPGTTTKVKVETASGRTFLVSKAKTSRGLLQRMRALRKVGVRLFKLKRKKEQNLQKLLTNFSLLPDFNRTEKIEKLQDQIPKIEARIAILRGDFELMKVIRSQLKDCEDFGSFGNGTNILIQENGQSPFYRSSYFIFAAVHAFPIDTRKHGSMVCAVIDGKTRLTPVKASHCFNLQDQKPGELAGSTFRACYGLPSGPNNGFIVIRHGLGYYHDEEQLSLVSGLVNSGLAQDVQVYLPRANGSC